MDDGSATATPAGAYQGFVDGTSAVSSAGVGTYAVANITTSVAVAENYAGWSLVVVYRPATDPTRNMVVCDGYQRVRSTSLSVDISLSGFTTPPFDTVTSKLGVVAYDGGKGSTEGTAGLHFGQSIATLAPVFNGLNPQNDVFNSAISALGQNVGTREPNYPNTLGFDADIFSPNTQHPTPTTHHPTAQRRYHCCSVGQLQPGNHRSGGSHAGNQYFCAENQRQFYQNRE